MSNVGTRQGLLALSPLPVFVLLYLATSILAGDFYKVPLTVAFMAAAVWAVAITRGQVRRRIAIFSRGAGGPEMMLMIWIFVLAGAFASAATTMGCIDATVNLTLSLLPPQLLLPGLFLAACFISISIGTSVGTIVALTPLAAGVAAQVDAHAPLLVAVVVGGSFFGDNLSFISDTTIIATQTQGCQPKDKFRVNSFIVAPAVVVVLAVYCVMGHGIGSTTHMAQSVEPWKVLPYLMVLLTAVAGLNVLAVLAMGILLTGIIGMASGETDVFLWMQSLGKGITGMGELIIITLMAGGLLEIIKHNGGITFIIERLTRNISGKRGAELSIGVLVAIVNICTANNTVAIITVGALARKIGQHYQLDPRKCASLLDTFSCFTQGLLPYGAQLLMASGLAALSPLQIIPYLYYPVAIGLAALLAIMLRYPRHYS